MVKKRKLKLFKNLLIALLLVSCSSQKEVLYQDQVVINDTLVLPAIHDHVCDTNGCFCIYIEEFRMDYTDTLMFEYLVTKKEWRSLTRNK